MYVNPDSSINEKLIAALYDSSRIIDDLVYFDWDNNGNYANEYSDLSLVATQVDLERASLVTDMPESINTIQGYSSAELTITLQGNRYSHEERVDVLLSRFNVNGPFFNRDLTGTRVKYEKRVTLADGTWVDIRQFTGIVRDLQIDHESGQVTIIAGDALQWINSPVTLPRWAADRYITSQAWAGAARPINASWVIGEVLRQAGTPVGPTERDDCVVSFSCMGSMLPSVGEQYHFPVSVNSDPHGLFTDPVNLLTTRTDVPYGTCIARSPGTGSARVPSGNQVRADRSRGWLTVPRNGTGEAGRNVGFAGWVYDDGGAGHNALPTDPFWYYEGVVMEMTLGTGTTPEVFVQFTHGQVFVYIQNSLGTSFGRWGFNRPSGQTAGWHYYDVNLRFRNNGISVVVTVDGTQIPGPQMGGNTSTGFTYTSNSYPPGDPTNTSNIFWIYYWDEAQFLQSYYGDTTAVYRAGQQFPKLTEDGLPWVKFTASMAEMSFIPDVENEGAWDVLGKLAIGEFATLMTNEYGQIIYQPHYQVQGNTSLQPQSFYTVDNVLSLVTNPSLDQYRNSITIAYTDRYQNVADLWTNDTPFDFYTPADTVTRLFGPFDWSDVVRVAQGPAPISGRQNAPGNGTGTNYQKAFRSRYTAVRADDYTVDAMDPNNDGNTIDGWFFQSWVIPEPNNRATKIATRNGSAANPALYIGARVIDNSDGTATSPIPPVSYVVRGKKIGEQKVGWYTIDDASVATDGRFNLRIEPSEWRQTLPTVQAIASQLLNDTTVPAPIVTGMKIPTDPRLQVGDVISVQPGESFSGPIYMQIMGLSRSAQEGEDTIDGRVIRTPSKWTLGLVGLSELGVSTILN